MTVVTFVFQARSSYLLPFLVLQVFDFFLTCLTVIGCFAYIVDVQDWVNNWVSFFTPSVLTQVSYMPWNFTLFSFVLKKMYFSSNGEFAESENTGFLDH